MSTTIKKTVLSIEQMKHLEELGLDISGASMMWISTEYPGNYLVPYNNEGTNLEFDAVSAGVSSFKYTPAYTLQDILEKLPMKIDKKITPRQIPVSMCLKLDGYDELCSAYERGEHIIKYVSAINGKGSEGEFRGKDLLELAYQELCWVCENGYL